MGRYKDFRDTIRDGCRHPDERWCGQEWGGEKWREVITLGFSRRTLWRGRFQKYSFIDEQAQLVLFCSPEAIQIICKHTCSQGTSSPQNQIAASLWTGSCREGALYASPLKNLHTFSLIKERDKTGLWPVTRDLDSCMVSATRNGCTWLSSRFKKHFLFLWSVPPSLDLEEDH